MKKKPNYIYSIISVALVLFLLGFFGAALLFTRILVNANKEKINVTVEIKENADSTALVALPQLLENSIFIKKESLKFVSKEDAAAYMQKAFPDDDAILKDGPIPFYDSYSLNLDANYLNKDSIESIRQIIKTNAAVADVSLDEGMIGEVAQNVEKIAFIAFAAALIFIIVAITLIHNTIRLNLYSDRFIIKNMELVGADWRFISRPYIRRGVRNGFISALIAVAILALIFYFIEKQSPEINLLLKSPVFLCGILLLILLGVFISWLSTLFVVNKYLRMRLDDLF